MDNKKYIKEIVFFARGGQGAKVAAEIIAQAAVSEGKFVQAFPNFGPERSGAPTKTYVRISERSIRTHEPVIDPDIVMVLDETLLESDDIKEYFAGHNLLIINSEKFPEELKEKLNFKGELSIISANKISMDIIGQPRPNTVILGKFAQVSGLVSLESIRKEFRKIFEEKIGKEACDKNVAAIEKAYEI